MSQHRHEFAVDAACDKCGVMLSELVLALSESNAALLTALENTVGLIERMPNRAAIETGSSGHAILARALLKEIEGCKVQFHA